MTYAAEPYAQFVDDLLTGLTGGEVRQRFVFDPDEETYPIATSDPLIPGSVRVFGQAGGVYRLFGRDRDFEVKGGAVRWLEVAGGAVRPDEETAFYVNFEVQRPAGTAPPLTDRHPGSVTRTLAESFAREYAVLSGQLEGVYRAGFLDTATGRDLDELVKLVGVVRRSGAFAVGTAVFSRLSPASADVWIEAGTRLSTVQPPAASFEITEDRVLRRGELTVEAPIVALAPGAAGVVPARAVAAIDRPILGVDSVSNPQPTRLIGDEEGDDELRRRARRAHDGAGKATRGALLAALTSLPGLREKDVRITQDHLAHPGVVKLDVVMPVRQELSQSDRDALAARVVEEIEETRPVGVRILPRLDFAEVKLDGQPQPFPGKPLPGIETLSGTGTLLEIPVSVTVIPTAARLTSAERSDLERRVRQAVDAFFDDIGIGEPVIYNRLIAMLMALDGVLDVAVWLNDAHPPEAPRNLFPADPGLRPVLGDLEVEIAGQLVVLSVAAKISLRGAGTLGDPEADRRAALDDVAERLKNGLRTLTAGGSVTRQVLQGFIASTPNYTATLESYQAEYLDAGVRIRKENPEIRIASGETVVVGRVTLLPGEIS